jgi:hypothetical protein
MKNSEWFGVMLPLALFSQGETVTKDAMQAAFDDYMQFANVREMHQPWAAGIVKEYSFDDVGTFIGVKVVDDAAWAKVVEGVYKGFSIGGKKLPGGYDAVTKTITALKLTEISLVDRPANPEALITMFKADNLESNMTEEEKQAARQQVQDLLAKGVVTVEELMSISKAHTPSDDTNNTPEQAPVQVSKGAVSQAFADLAAPAEEFAKGMWSVKELATLVQSLYWLQQDADYESQYEGDGSPIPAKLANALSVLGAVLVEMAQEEVAELLATVTVTAVPAVETLKALIDAADKDGTIGKFSDAIDVFKAGARNSKNDADRIQKAHDLLCDLGATCGVADDGAEKVAKADHTEALTKVAAQADELQKALTLVESTSGELGTLRKAFDATKGELDSLQKAHTELQALYDQKPTDPKGALMAVSKGDDLNGSSTKAVQPEVQPVLKADGSIDEVQTMIKMIHQGGGRPS